MYLVFLLSFTKDEYSVLNDFLIKWSVQIVRDRRWKEVTAVFNFPSTATNASFVLRKYYNSLLLHYEQIYYFKAQAWNPLSSGVPREHLLLIYIYPVKLFIFIIQPFFHRYITESFHDTLSCSKGRN